jgi:DNA-binding GntR family transcriptional regulator
LINKYGNIPLYVQLKDLIIEKIDSGEFAEDIKIPSEQELCEMYDISRPTVRQAISELTNSGYLFKEKGKGTYVSSAKSRIDIKNYSGFTDSILDSDVPGERNIISVKIINEHETDKKLYDIFTGTHGYGQITDLCEIKFLTIFEKEVLSLNASYIPTNLFPDIENDIRSKKSSYDILKGKYPLIPAKSKSILEVVYTDQNDAQYLHMQTGQALLKIENILFSKSGQAVEFVVSRYRADKCKLIFENIK